MLIAEFSVTFCYCYAECRNAGILRVVMLSAVMLNVVTLNVIVLRVIMLSVFILSVVAAGNINLSFLFTNVLSYSGDK